MSEYNTYDCVIGSELRGIAKNIRTDVKTDQRVLPDFNPCWTVLNDNALCKVQKKVRLSDEEYIRCTQRLRDANFSLKDAIDDNIEGSRIYCEHKNKKPKIGSTKRQQALFKSRIAIGVLSKKEVKSRIYRAGERFVKNPYLEES